MNRHILLACLTAALPFAALMAVPTPTQAQPDRGYNGGGTVRCESNDNRQRVCDTGWRDATLVRQLSTAQCIEGRNWGSRNGSVWVSNGCRAEFAAGRSGGWGNGQWNGNGNGNSTAGSIRCESQDNRERVCNTGWRSATLVRQLSDTRCVEGRNWGQRNGAIWVNNGCRGEFAAGRGGGGGNGRWNGNQSNYSVTCNSDNNRQRACAWDRRQGRPVLIEQTSNTRCVEGRNWGSNGDSIWVNSGCRARFGAR
ncbi:MAG: DUF3011 domain-containing protein [Stenotrophomonas sp.]